MKTLDQHSGPLLSLKWNKKGDCLATGSFDKTAIVWDPSSGEVKQQFSCHSGMPKRPPCRVARALICLLQLLSLTSTGETIFRSPRAQLIKSSIFVNWEIHNPSDHSLDTRCAPTSSLRLFCIFASIATFFFQNEVNAIKWDPTGSYLASCSDDCSAKALGV